MCRAIAYAVSHKTNDLRHAEPLCEPLRPVATSSSDLTERAPCPKATPSIALRSTMSRTSPAAGCAWSPQGRFEGSELVDGDRFIAADAWGKHLFHRWESGHVVHVHLGLFGRFFRFVRARPVPRETVRMRLSRLEPEGDQLTLDLVGPTACALLSQKEHRALIARLGPDPLRADADPLRGHG